MAKAELKKSDVRKSWLNWFMFAQSNYNYERLQATSFAHAMLPIMKKLYPNDKEEQKQGIIRHMSFFNTEPICGSVIHGVTVAMEEERANGQPITDEAFNGIKTGFMGPLAGLGDTLTQGVITHIMLAICIGITNNSNIAGPIIFVLAQFIIMTGISYNMWFNGYKYGRRAVEEIMSGGKINRVIEAASLLGTMVMGGLVGRFIPLEFYLNFDLGGGAQFNLQYDLLDKLMPGLIPLILTLVVLRYVRKGVSPIKLMGALIVFGIITGCLGIF